jgi:alpha-glucoside transport system permease protein
MSRGDRGWSAWMYVLPALLLLALFLVLPTIQTIWLSLHGGTGFSPTQYVGLQNYVQLFTRDRFFLSLDEWPPSGAVVNNILWLLLFTSGTVSLGLLIAVLADRVRYEPLIKAVIFVPMVISATATSVIFRFVYSPDPVIGVVNAALIAIFPNLEPVPWLGRTSLVNIALIGAGIWIWTGLAMTVLSAAYKSLDREVLEAAAVDGASAWQTFWRISLPMMIVPIGVVAVTMVINALKMLDLVLVMTQGGPRNASRTIAFTMFWEVFNNSLAGYGSAVAVVLLILVAPIILLQVRRFRAEEALR